MPRGYRNFQLARRPYGNRVRAVDKGESMRAAIIEKFGPPENIQVRDCPQPEPQAGQLLVKVMASATNPVEAKIRAAGSWSGIKLPAVLGYDGAGVVAALGAGVTDFAV